MRLLALFSDKRLKHYPDVPTVKELGYDLAIESPVGLVAPKGLDPKIAARLVGTRLDDEVVKDAAHAAAAETEPGSDLHASAEYRRHLAGVLAARVLREARERARSVR